MNAFPRLVGSKMKWINTIPGDHMTWSEYDDQKLILTQLIYNAQTNTCKVLTASKDRKTLPKNWIFI